jgi:hypothetical protein
MEYLRFFAELGAVLMAAIAILFVIGMLLRTYKIPECYSCGAMKVRPSRVVGFWDTFGIAFLIRPYRCLGCRERFHALLLFGEPGKPSIVQVLRRQRVVKIAFRFNNGLPTRIAIRVIDLYNEPDSMPSSSAILEV